MVRHDFLTRITSILRFIRNLRKRGEEVDVIPTGNASNLDASEDKNEDISIGLLFASKAIVQLIGAGQTSVKSRSRDNQMAYKLPNKF